MTIRTLPPTLRFSIQPAENRIRLVVFRDGSEWVCRRTEVATLTRFLQDDTPRLFKGRLQLIKNQGEIALEVKGVNQGVIATEYFLQRLIELNP